jgi:hypothetical protein
MQGGLLQSGAVSAAQAAAMFVTGQPGADYLVPLEIKTSFLRPARMGDIEIRVAVRQWGRRVVFLEVSVGPEAKPYARLSMSYYPRPESGVPTNPPAPLAPHFIPKGAEGLKSLKMMKMVLAYHMTTGFDFINMIAPTPLGQHARAHTR